MMTSRSRHSFSSLRVWQTCPREYHYSYELRLETRPTERMERGTSIHALLEAWFSGGPPPEFDLSSEESIRVTATAREYAARWGEELARAEIVGVEQPVELRVDGVGVIVGVIDVVLTDRATGLRWAMEHKTTSRDVTPGSAYWERLAIDRQIHIYELALALGPEPVGGTVYDVIALPDLERLQPTAVPRMRKDGQPRKGQRLEVESLEAFAARYVEALREPDRFRRVYLPHRCDHVLQTLEDIRQIVRQIESSPDRPRNPSSCQRGRDLCPFFAICAGKASILDYPTRST